MLPKINAGTLRHVVTILSPPATTNAYGEVDPTQPWTTLGTRRASIQSRDGRKVFFGHEVQAETTHFVTLRYYAGLAPNWQFQFESGRVFNILSIVDEDEVHVAHHCQVKEVI